MKHIRGCKYCLDGFKTFCSDRALDYKDFTKNGIDIGKLRGALKDSEVVTDLFFIGGVGEPQHNDFYFEYYHPERQQKSLYFPDFLIETSSGRYLVIEVKTPQERFSYEADKKKFVGDKQKIVSEVFAKEVGFQDFKEKNDNFDYHIIFDASLQDQQRKLFEDIEKMS